MTGEVLAKNIEDTLDEVRLPLENCRGQGYDGANAMSGKSNISNFFAVEEKLFANPYLKKNLMKLFLLLHH